MTTDEYADVLRKCENLISMEEGLNFIDMLQPDEVGVCIAFSSLRTVSGVMEQKFKNMKIQCQRINISSNTALSANDMVKEHTNPRWMELYYWSQLAKQNPDGIFEIDIKNGDKHYQTIICYEADGHAKGVKDHNFRNVIRKMMNAVDLHRCYNRDSAIKKDSDAAYTVRSNLKTGVGGYVSDDINSF